MLAIIVESPPAAALLDASLFLSPSALYSRFVYSSQRGPESLIERYPLPLPQELALYNSYSPRMDQHSRSLALGKRTERAPSAASSTFHPHRPVPLPLRSFHPSPSPLLSNDAPSYASYSRPRRDSLSTSSPTSLSSSPVTPITPISPASPASPPRRIVSARSLRALRRRDIVHPTKFEGATVIGRYPPLSPACSSSEDELTAPSSVGTAASSVVAEHLNVGFTIGGTDSPKQRSRKKSQSTNDGDNELPFPLELDDPTIETGTSTINKQKVLTQTTDSRQHVHDAATNGDQEVSASRRCMLGPQ